jgi:endonuclease/exonuclease/phosphatase family metal-dependent hydrolase
MLKLVTYNIHYGRDEKSLLASIAEMAKLQTDIFCFQEVRRSGNNPFIGDKILATLGPNWQAEFFLQPGIIPSTALGLCVIWKSSVLELKGVEKLYLPLLQKLSWWDIIFQKFARANIELGTWLKIFSGASKPEISQRGAIICDFDFQGLPVRVCNAHLDYAGGMKHRLRQIRYIRDQLISKPQIPREIICGDFNTIGPLWKAKKVAKKILQKLDNKFLDTMSVISPTLVLFQRCDYILQKGFIRAEAKVLRKRGSDHWPLMAVLE